MDAIILDPFQKEALAWIDQDHSVFISAPTGAGKTLIAEHAVRQAFSQGKKAIYTAPVKALSNQKFRDFRAQFGENQVGILTGDVSINPEASIVIMTTEIYRNSLFDHEKRLENVAWVIFDEIHYLDDPERGTVWEEAILFTPPHIRMLALSATVPNVTQLAEWIRSVHDRPIAIVEDHHRPVPLEFQFQCQGKIFYDRKNLLQHGYLHRESWRPSSRERHRGFRMPHAKPNRLDHLILHLKEKNRLPVIYFAFGRRRTEYLATEIAPYDFLTIPERKQILELYHSLIERYDLTAEKSAQEMLPLIENGIAYHHAGMLPSLKEVIEQLFTSRLIKVIFTTETFALGINMPARSVVFDELEKYYGNGFRFLTTRDFYQMAGRAGRRGMDEKGFVYIRINPQHVPFNEMERIIFGKPEPIRSQLNAAYATVLNLYKELGPELLKIYPRSFHYYQSSKARREDGRSLLESKISLLRELRYLDETKQEEGETGHMGKLTAKGEFAASIFGYELLLGEMHAAGILESMDETELAVLLSGLVYEPRKGDHVPRLTPRQEKIRKKSEHFSKLIYRHESKHRIHPFTKNPHLNLAKAVEAWMDGTPFDKLHRFTSTDEGELVRHFRMIIQLLRELMHAHNCSDILRARASQARDLINRDVVDAERQLRV